jgi:hypothetical protein
MSRISAIACLIAFTWNAALAGMGGLLFCAHETGGAHWVAQTEHSEESHDPCCHHDGQAEADVTLEVPECASCEDTLLEVSFQDFAASGLERLSRKAPVALAPSSNSLRYFVPTTFLLSADAGGRTSLFVGGARCEFSDTIRILC